MKTAFIFFLIGAICGALSLHIYNERQAQRGYPPYATTGRSDGVSSLKEKAGDTADNIKDSISKKLQDWKLTPDDIRGDLARTGEVVRTKAAAAGDKMSDAKVVTVIKAKYVLDRDLSALDINVDCKDGRVTLRGVVASEALIGRAVMLALDTSGVTDVAAKLSATAKL
jgi:osmotically-inducible protein OsmY